MCPIIRDHGDFWHQQDRLKMACQSSDHVQRRLSTALQPGVSLPLPLECIRMVHDALQGKPLERWWRLFCDLMERRIWRPVAWELRWRRQLVWDRRPRLVEIFLRNEGVVPRFFISSFDLYLDRHSAPFLVPLPDTLPPGV